MLTTLGILAALLALQLIYPFVTVLAAQARPYRVPPPSPSVADKMPDFACIVTAYRNAEIAKPLLESLLRQTYPNWTAYLVADECPELSFRFSDERIVLLRPENPLRLKAKSIMYAWERFRRPHDHVVIFDADNVAHPDFLDEMLPFVRAGFVCAQGQRKAKNTDTDYAALDSLGEHYKNHIEREVPYRLGGSAVISGSGMVTRSDVYRAYLDGPEIQQGQRLWKKMLQEDKILQNFLLQQGHRIAYARDAVVYDEKSANGRSRGDPKRPLALLLLPECAQCAGLAWARSGQWKRQPSVLWHGDLGAAHVLAGRRRLGHGSGRLFCLALGLCRAARCAGYFFCQHFLGAMARRRTSGGLARCPESPLFCVPPSH
jgi:Glycosyltransferases, probably involved in cell wall biogenesis